MWTVYLLVMVGLVATGFYLGCKYKKEAIDLANEEKLKLQNDWSRVKEEYAKAKTGLKHKLDELLGEKG